MVRIPDLSGTDPAGSGDFPLLPAEWFNVRVKDCREETAKTGTPGIALQMEITDGPFAKRQIWDRIWISDAALGFVRQKLEALGLNIPQGPFDLNAATLVGQRCAVLIKHETYEGKTREKVSAYDAIAKSEFGEDWRAEVDKPAAVGGGATPDDTDIPFGMSKV